MVTTLIALIGVAAYFAIGFLLVRANGAEMWRKAQKSWSVDSNRRSSVKAQIYCWLFLWPVMLPTAGISSLGDRLVDQYDPERWEREVKEQRKLAVQRERRIDELERELGINTK